MSEHAVAVEIVSHGYISARFTCTAPDGALCKMRCPADCESWNPDHDQEYDHQLVPCECNVVEWLEADDAIERYRGATTLLHDGPIEVEYDDGYCWWYTDAAPAAPEVSS